MFRITVQRILGKRQVQQYEFKSLFLFSGSGGATLGTQRAKANWRGMEGSFRTLAGIDVDLKACENFRYLTGSKAVCLDLFERRDYVAFHGSEPLPDWKEATVEDIFAATGGEYPDFVFLSPPCKGFSALLPQKTAETDRYQALNRLVVRGIFLTLEAFKDDLPAFFFLENVPRIVSRGKKLLHTITKMLESYGYAVDGRSHDLGEIAGLGQHRKRYLLVARNPQKISTFLYHPPKQRVKSIGEILAKVPLPDDPAGGPMHRLPRLQWKTWVRLALIPAGGDWRDLEKIATEEYRLEHVPRGGGSFGVQDWDSPSHTVTGRAKTGGSTATNIADPRLTERKSRHPGAYRVVKLGEPALCVTGSRFGSGALAISDPRTGFKSNTYTAIYQVNKWNKEAATVTGVYRPNNGAISIADPRVGGGYSDKRKILEWGQPASTVTGTPDIQSGAQSVADPRLNCKPRSGMMGVQRWDEPAKTIIGSSDIHAGAAAVADPRIPKDNETLDPPPIIISMDGTWHRPLTTLELAAIQGLPLTVNGKPLRLSGKSDAAWREQIGNMVPPDAAQVMAEQALFAFLASVEGVWTMDAEAIWVAPEKDKNDQPILPA